MRKIICWISCLFIIIIYLSITSASFAQLNESIVLFLHLDEGKGDVTADSSQYGNDGTIFGPVWVNGKYGSALLFDGINDYVQINSNDSLQLSQQGLTLAAWFRTEETARADLMIIEKGSWDAGEYALSYPGYANYRVRFQINQIPGKETAQIDSVTGVPDLSDNEWHHAAGVYDAVNHIFRVYVDGVLEEEQGANAHVFTPDDLPVYLGTRNNQSLYYVGEMDEVMIANVPFTDDQIKKLMDGTLMSVNPVGALSAAWGAIKYKTR